nr:MAG TPA: hypothetical protein [Caudoviricetes sp.]
MPSANAAVAQSCLYLLFCKSALLSTSATFLALPKARATLPAYLYPPVYPPSYCIL